MSSLYQGGVTDNAPYGFLRRVEAVEKTRSGVIVTTINAAMTHNSFDIKKGFMILVGLSKNASLSLLDLLFSLCQFADIVLQICSALVD